MQRTQPKRYDARPVFWLLGGAAMGLAVGIVAGVSFMTSLARIRAEMVSGQNRESLIELVDAEEIRAGMHIAEYHWSRPSGVVQQQLGDADETYAALAIDHEHVTVVFVYESRIAGLLALDCSGEPEARPLQWLIYDPDQMPELLGALPRR